MAQLILKVTRQDTSKDWFNITPNNISTMFTQEEVDVLLAGKNQIESFNGFISVETKHIDEHTMQKVFTFENDEQVAHLKVFLEQPEANSIFGQRQEILKNKRQELGINETLELIIV